MVKVEKGQRVRITRFVLEYRGPSLSFRKPRHLEMQPVESWEGVVETVYSDWTFDLRLLDGTLANFDPRAKNADFVILK